MGFLGALLGEILTLAGFGALFAAVYQLFQIGAELGEIKELLVRQVTSPVRWSESMQWLIAQGFTRFIELGPGNVLSGLMKRINRDVEMLFVSDCATLDAAVARLTR